MAAFFAKIVAFFMAVLAFFGINIQKEPVKKEAFSQAQVEYYDKSVNVSVSENASTGYIWQYEIKGESVSLSGDKRISDPATKGLSGAPVTRCFTFKAIKPGKTTVKFEYLRPWEKNSTINAFTLVFAVDEQLNITVSEAK